MTLRVSFSDDAAATLSEVGDFLESQPAEHNLVLTILHQRAGSNETGRFWVVRRHGEPVGLVLQSPVDFRATLTPMDAEAARAAAEAIASEDRALPGIEGEASAAAAFAGRWTECARTGAQPTHGTRLQLLGDLVVPDAALGSLRVAAPADLALACEWFGAFADELGQARLPEARVAQRVECGQVTFWRFGDADVCLVGHSDPVAGTVRIGPVYTPPEARNRGYAGACVGFVSRRMVEVGLRCVLYTDLANPTSNSVYRSLGYRTISENVRYVFGNTPDT